MVVDSTGVRTSPSNIEAITKMPPATNVEELCAFLGMTGYLRQHVEKESIVATPIKN